MNFDIEQLKEDEKVADKDDRYILSDNEKLRVRLAMTGLFITIIGLVLLLVPMNNSWFIAISFGAFCAIIRSMILILGAIQNQS